MTFFTYFDIINLCESSGECYQIIVTILPSPHHRTLYQWWAEYMESLGDLESALQFYRDGSDHTSIVRIHCYMGNIDKVGVASVWLD